MTEQEIEKLVQDKLNEAYQENVPPKKFFLTENGHVSSMAVTCTTRSSRMSFASCRRP